MFWLTLVGAILGLLVALLTVVINPTRADPSGMPVYAYLGSAGICLGLIGLWVHRNALPSRHTNGLRLRAATPIAGGLSLLAVWLGAHTGLLVTCIIATISCAEVGRRWRDKG